MNDTEPEITTFVDQDGVPVPVAEGEPIPSPPKIEVKRVQTSEEPVDINVANVDGKVVVTFSRLIRWLNLSNYEARRLAEMIRQASYKKDHKVKVAVNQKKRLKNRRTV